MKPCTTVTACHPSVMMGHDAAQKLRDARDRRRVIAIAAMRDDAGDEQDRIDAARAAHNEIGKTVK